MNNSTELSPTDRFTDRLSHYTRARPSYPNDLFTILVKLYGIDSKLQIAEVGSGTGQLTRLLLETGSNVVAIEPNQAMRGAAEKKYAKHSNFKSHAGSAEITGLDSKSYDYIFAAQAFHWFQEKETLAEFTRILRTGGLIFLIWNHRKTSTDFSMKYDEALKAHCPDYGKSDHRSFDENRLGSFLEPSLLWSHKLPYYQDIDQSTLVDRVLSSSYVPKNTDASNQLIKKIEYLYNKYQIDGTVRIPYETRIYSGPPVTS